jgi:hypothetical protein
MEKQTEKIKRFSKVICILLTITYIALIVVGVIELFAWIWSTANINTEIVTIDGVEMELPLLFKLGEHRVFWPVIWKSGFDFTGLSVIQGFASTVGIGDFLSTIFTLIAIRLSRRVFLLLRENGSPFRDDIVKSLRKLAIFLLLMGGISGAVPFLAAGIVWVFCLIFDYGRMLQNESDTTL